MDCTFEKTILDTWKCTWCGAEYGYLAVRQCDTDPTGRNRRPSFQTSPGPLRQFAAPATTCTTPSWNWVGEGPTRACPCQDRIIQMNAWGPAGCREHLDEIVGWLARGGPETRLVEVRRRRARQPLLHQADGAGGRQAGEIPRQI